MSRRSSVGERGCEVNRRFAFLTLSAMRGSGSMGCERNYSRFWVEVRDWEFECKTRIRLSTQGSAGPCPRPICYSLFINSTNSFTVRPAFRIWSRNKPGPRTGCNGIERGKIEPDLVSTTWLPRCRDTSQPARSKAFTASAPGVRGSLGIDRDFDFSTLDGQG